jgi:hypothetical protein
MPATYISIVIMAQLPSIIPPPTFDRIIGEDDTGMCIASGKRHNLFDPSNRCGRAGT